MHTQTLYVGEVLVFTLFFLCTLKYIYIPTQTGLHDLVCLISHPTTVLLHHFHLALIYFPTSDSLILPSMQQFLFLSSSFLILSLPLSQLPPILHLSYPPHIHLLPSLYNLIPSLTLIFPIFIHPLPSPHSPQEIFFSCQLLS